MTEEKIGRIGLLESGAVIIGSVEEKVCVITESDAELKAEIDKYSRIVCAGVMNTMFNGKRFGDWLLENYKETEIEEKFIFYYYVKYYSKINIYITFKHIFYAEEEIQKTGRLVREIRIWKQDEIEKWTAGIDGILGKLTTLSVIDFIKSTSENEIYERVLEFNGIEDKGHIESEVSLNSIWAQSTKYGEVIKAYRTHGIGFTLERMTENNIDDYLCFISLTEQNDEIANSISKKHNDKMGLEHIKSMYEVISKLRKEVNGLMIYEMSRSKLTFVIRRNIDTPEILKKVHQIISESNLKGIYDTVAVGEKQSALDGADKNKTNIIQFDMLANINKVKLNSEKDIRNTVCYLFEELKSMPIEGTAVIEKTEAIK